MAVRVLKSLGSVPTIRFQLWEPFILVSKQKWESWTESQAVDPSICSRIPHHLSCSFPCRKTRAQPPSIRLLSAHKDKINLSAFVQDTDLKPFTSTPHPFPSLYLPFDLDQGFLNFLRLRNSAEGLIKMQIMNQEAGLGTGILHF